MAWIESHQALGRHPKTRRAAKLLNVSRVAVVGHLHFLWWWCLDFAQDGDLSGYDDDEIAEASEWEDDPVTFVAALMDAGFLTSARQVHDWHDYAGKLVDQRKANAEKQARWRNRNKVTKSEDSNGYVTVTERLRNGATVPNPTVPNRTVPVNQEVNPYSGDGATDAPPTAASVRPAPKPSTLNRQQQERFDRWYRDYPNKQHRPEAERAWRKLDPDDALTATMIADLAARRLGRKWGDGIVEHPATYLNQRAWEDDIEPVRMPSRASPNGRVNPVEAMAALARQFREEEARESRDVSGAVDAPFTVRSAAQ